MVDRGEFERWWAEAARALELAQLSSRAGLHNWACFSAEQAAQLAVKGLLHGLGQAPWGHDLVALGEALGEAGLEVTGELADALRRLSRHHIAARYPDTLPGGTPGDRYAGEDAERALTDVELVLRVVDAAWHELDA